MQKRAAIYARYSSALQRERSIDDQLALCRAHAAREGFQVVATFQDSAKTGASLMGRAGCLDMLEAGRAGQFDVVLVEALDRLSRDQEDLAFIHKRLQFASVQIITVHEGEADTVQIGVRAMLGSLYLKDLAHKVRRGMRGVIADGRSPGGKAYGYKPRKGEPGELDIDEDEAAVVRRIFEEFVAGRGIREIVYGLNADRVPAPRGAEWRVATITGNNLRGHGILQNPLYAGELVWNRVRMVRDPDTGKRVSRPNPESEWMRAPAPHLAIIDRQLWDAAQARKQAQQQSPRGKRAPRKPHLLAGLLHCGHCGGSMVLDGQHSGHRVIRCGRARDAGTCSSKRRVRLDKIENVVVGGLQEQLAKPAAIEAYLRGWREEARERTQAAARDRAKLERKLQQCEGAIARLVDALAAGKLPQDLVEAKAGKLQEERRALQAELALAQQASNVIALAPEAVAQHAAALGALGEQLAGLASENAEAAEALRRLVGNVFVYTAPQLAVQVDGALAPLLSQGGGIEVVAEARYSAYPPIKFGLWRA